MIGLFLWEILLRCTWDSTLKDTKVTDVVCRGSIHPPSFPFLLPLLQWCKVPLGICFFFFLSPEIHKQRPCNLFLPKLLFTICFRAGHVLSGREKYWGEEGRRKERHAWRALHCTPRHQGFVQQALAFRVGWQQQKYITTAQTDSLPVPVFIR